MARRMDIAQKIARGYGVIDLEHPECYQPWLHTKEVASGNGRRHMIPDLYHPKRMIHLMSNLEKDVYYMLRRNRKVLELFEQVPLNLKTTIGICEGMGIQHPKEPFTSNNIVMTTDFLALVELNGKTQFLAFAVKMSSDLKDRRVLEKLLIEQQYWERQNIKWSIIDETAIIERKQRKTL